MRCRGYRAPSFSIDARTPWAHPVLAEQGYAYSSSVAPIAPRSLWLARIAALRLAAGRRRRADRAAGHHRRAGRAADGGRRRGLLPAAALSLLELGDPRGSIEHDERPAIFYFHPWEIDPDQPRVAGALGAARELRHYTNLEVMRPKLLKLLRDHRWGRTDEVAAAERARLQ